MHPSIIHLNHGPIHLLARSIPNIEADISVFVLDRSQNLLKAKSNCDGNLAFVEKYALCTSHYYGGLAPMAHT